jgi:ADP-ribose pyrophosphatase YjhB (NUDIX family)
MRTNISARGVVKRDGKVLLIHRFKNGDEYWVVPGGGVEEGETVEEALKREMREETSLEMLSCRFLIAVETPKGEQHLYECEMGQGEVKIQGPEVDDESKDNQYILTWVPIEQVKELKILYPEIVKDYL